MSIEYLTPWDAQGNRVIADDGVCFAIREGGTMGYVLAEAEPKTYWGMHEASGQDITFQEEIAYSLVTGGGKPGQGYPAVLVEYEDENSITQREQ